MSCWLNARIVEEKDRPGVEDSINAGQPQIVE